MGEALVRRHATSYLILRPSAMLGKYSRPNSLIKILQGDCTLTLSEDSIMDYVLHTDIREFIFFAMQEKLQGIYNVVSNADISLSEVEYVISKALGKKRKVEWGMYKYNCGHVSRKKISETRAFSSKTSRETIEEFILSV